MNIDLNLPPPRKSHLSESLRYIIFATISENCVNGVPKKGIITRMVETYSVDESTIRRLWRRGKESITNGTEAPNMSLVPNLSLRLKGIVGIKRTFCDLSRISEIELRNRTNIRSLAAALSVPKTTVHRNIQEGKIRAHSNALKPTLSEENKKQRLIFCLSMLNRNVEGVNPTYYDMYNSVHLDEKWFYMSKETQRYYLLPEEPDPLRTCKSKRFIEKVMFLAVVARPRFDVSRTCIFDGKIGIFPFTYEDPAKRNSKNRRVGTMVTKATQSITKDVYRAYILEKVLPAIRACWPHSEGVNHICIQQDNARPHISENDPEFVTCAVSDGFDIKLNCQPPNSPDLNVLDLGYFRSIQTLQHQQAPKTVPELVAAVEKSFKDLKPDTLEKVFYSLQGCMNETIKVLGGNNYKIPHIGKEHLQRNGELPCQLSCDIGNVTQADIHLALPCPLSCDIGNVTQAE